MPNPRKRAQAVATAVGVALGCFTLAAPTRDAQAGLLIDLRITNINGVPVPAGTKHGVPTFGGAGDTFTIDVFAVVSGANAVNDEALRSVTGSFRSTSAGLLGDLSAALVAPFNGLGSQKGSQVDVDGDGDLDIGPAPTGGPGSAFFLARYDGPTAYTDGAVVATDPAAEEFRIAQLFFTVTQFEFHPPAFITFARRQNPDGSNNLAYAGWNEDGTGTASVRNGESPYAVSGVTIGIPEPGAAALTALASLGLLARRRRRMREPESL